MDKVILRISKERKMLTFDNVGHKVDTLIIDFYNCYCSMIRFHTFKTFSEDTFRICIASLIEAAKDRQLIIVSKPIFEVKTTTILKITKKFKNIKYIIVRDEHNVKSRNKERDDYACLMISNTYKSDSNIIISNDRYSNFKELVSLVKPFSMELFHRGNKREICINNKNLEDISSKLKMPDRSGFKYINSFTRK
jgi:hypothetical protein